MGCRESNNLPSAHTQTSGRTSYLSNLTRTTCYAMHRVAGLDPLPYVARGGRRSARYFERDLWFFWLIQQPRYLWLYVYGLVKAIIVVIFRLYPAATEEHLIYHAENSNLGGSFPSTLNWPRFPFGIPACYLGGSEWTWSSSNTSQITIMAGRNPLSQLPLCL